jgi:hypothetical protein
MGLNKEQDGLLLIHIHAFIIKVQFHKLFIIYYLFPSK